jgi:hypothetical protein
MVALADIVRAAGPEYLQSHAGGLLASQRRALADIVALPGVAEPKIDALRHQEIAEPVPHARALDDGAMRAGQGVEVGASVVAVHTNGSSPPFGRRARS